MAPAFYNEHDPFAAAWLRNLISAGLIAPGEVDERSIVDVRPSDLVGFGQCHFFAGIGGWSLALRMAGWPDDRPVWTGSCPCQPFSAAGRGAGFSDPRHLWPEFFRLIGECRPAIVVGEQVASRDGLGWLDLVSSDLEGAVYAFGATDTCAAGFGAPHIRQRLWWVGLADADGRQRNRVADGQRCLGDREAAGRQQSDRELECGGATLRMAHCGGSRSSLREREDLRGTRGRSEGRAAQQRDGASALGLGDAAGERCGEARRSGTDPGSTEVPSGTGAAHPWSDLEWLPCRDGKARPTRPGLFPLAHGVSARVGKLRAAGNAIVPQVGAVFVEAVMGAIGAGLREAAE